MLFCLRAVFWISLTSVVLSNGDLSNARTHDFLAAANAPIAHVADIRDQLSSYCDENKSTCSMISAATETIGRQLRAAVIYAGEQLEQEKNSRL